MARKIFYSGRQEGTHLPPVSSITHGPSVNVVSAVRGNLAFQFRPCVFAREKSGADALRAVSHFSRGSLNLLRSDVRLNVWYRSSDAREARIKKII